ncbi:tail component of prophage [Escherichia coli]|nr:tail component of prophage [Escherichia coli]
MAAAKKDYEATLKKPKQSGVKCLRAIVRKTVLMLPC